MAWKYPGNLPGGMRKRAAIARPLFLPPRITLRDEPFGALDPTTRLHMQALLVDLWREAQATVFFVTHSIEEAVYLGDRVYVFSSAPGTILREMEVPPPDRPPKEMQREPEFMEKVFEIRDLIDNLSAPPRAGDDYAGAGVSAASARGRDGRLPQRGIPLPLEPAAVPGQPRGRGLGADSRPAAAAGRRR